ncbi:MAG: hypothetical protein Q8Q09_22600 [Deltaproteobacteria bacterium]|nr:hypothetical protein [Deltaproteobacteria bacterium]
MKPRTSLTPWALAALGCAALVAGCSEPSTPEPTLDASGTDTSTSDASRADTGTTLPGDGNAPPQDSGTTAERCTTAADCTRATMCSVATCRPDGTCGYGPDTTLCECDPDCHSAGARGSMGWQDPGRSGVEYDPDSDGLIVRGETRMGDYLWVPNSSNSTFSKWDANTQRELARYRVGLIGNDSANSPSRVVVDGEGNAFVATRGLGIIGTVTKVAADLRDCVDRNGNGMIDTSSGPTDVRPMGQDECVLWSTQVGPAGGLVRALAVGPATEDEPGGSVWAGICASATGQWRLNSRTGAIVQTFNIPRCTYGAVATRDGNIWFHTPSGGVTPISAHSNMIGEYRPISAAPAACRSSYGITADANGRIWLSRAGNGAAGYDPASNTWSCMQASAAIPGGRPGALGSGITVDATNRVWAPQAGSPLVFYVWPATAFVPGGTIPDASVTTYNLGRAFGSSALGADRSGRMWVLQGSELVRFDPATSTQTTTTGPVGTYTYTDFTGSVRRLVLAEGTYTQDYERCATGRFTNLAWTANTPGESRLDFSIRTADSAAALASAAAITVAQVPMATSPVNIEDALMSRTGSGSQRFLRVSVRFRPGMATPVLRALSVEHRCPPTNPG